MAESNSSTNSFLREMKRRKVTKTCVLYAILCWVVLQVGDIVYPALGLDPDATSLLFLYLAIAGLPVTFAFAWFLQITPQGIVRTGDFVERRILDNSPPINDRRQANVTNFFSKGPEGKGHRWVVSAETGPLAGLTFGIERTLMLGRSLDCDLALVTPQVSRHHARLELEDDHLVIEDLGSANGTIVNGRKIQGRRELRNEDELRFHDIVFRVTENFSSAQREVEATNQTTFIERSD